MAVGGSEMVVVDSSVVVGGSVVVVVDGSLVVDDTVVVVVVAVTREQPWML